MRLAALEAERLGYSTANVAIEQDRLARALIREHEAIVDALSLSIVTPFDEMLDPLRTFFSELQFGNLNPAMQIQTAEEEFRRIAAQAQAGSTTAIRQLQGAGEAFIAQAERFGASPAGVAARTEVANVVDQVMTSLTQAQKEASAGVEDQVKLARERIVDTLRELIAEGQLTREEIKRLGRR
jgi:hypothetical protein